MSYPVGRPKQRSYAGLALRIICALMAMAIVQRAHGFSAAPLKSQRRVSPVTLNMGMFDGIAKAFSNKEYKENDRRVRASHILIKGDGAIEKIDDLMGEINERVKQEPDRLAPIFAELARRESQCSSASQGGDLGLFGAGTMVRQFDMVLFPDESERTPPPPGAMIGPVPTEFGCHVILVTQREANKNQVEEKLARND